MTVALGDFAYRAEMDDGTVEHELCPVVVVEVFGEPRPNPDETDATEWIRWPDLVSRVRSADVVEPVVGRPDPPPCCGRDDVPREWLDREDAVDSLLDAVPGRAHVSRRTGDATSWHASRERIDASSSAFIAERRYDVPEADDAIDVLHAAISELDVRRGKRLRPLFVAAGFVAAGGDPDEAPLDAAAAVELLHTFALLHDDVMDRSAIRRGRPTAQHAFAPASQRRRGDADWFGVSAAILAGDLAFVWADRLFDRLDHVGIEPERVVRARGLFTRLRTEVIAGQYLDLQTRIEPGWPANPIRCASRCSSRRGTRPPVHCRSARHWPAPTRRWIGASPTTATPSERRSSSATTCSVCSANSSGSARAAPTTCARASGRC